ncbi:hypothetical protein QTO34_014212 [Cnephaeus nilssonii]|uniref:Iron hydrogenase large subunit C-terminal domain-containing protein n=1 Tax=Cnephaeus nilssonii TaxID=3371016 RepID=A0AA40I663_CNENI|nr:hypothetical protein QTO34_014212 [Eptesicus nilssonii]
MDQCLWDDPDCAVGLLELCLGHCGHFPSLDTPQGRKDTASSSRGDQSILESQKEFVHRYCQHHEEEPQLPMLTSACPGWDQYAEHVLVTHHPHLCKAKSPQQIMGSLDYFNRWKNLSPRQDFPYHCGPVL